MKDNLQNFSKDAADKLKLTLSSTSTPSFLLSSGTNAILFLTASAGFFRFSSLPFKIIFPVLLYAPKRVLQSSDFPAPTSPAIPSISPFLTCKFISFILPLISLKFSVLKIVSPIGISSLLYASSKVLPSISSTISFVVVDSAIGYVPINFPFLITV